MSVYEKISAARKNMDLEAWVSLLHEDYTFVRHQSNTTLSRKEWIPMIEGFFEAMKNGKWRTNLQDVFMKIKIYWCNMM